MKLYSTIISERNSRAANKGGDEFLEIELSAFGKRIGCVVLETVEDASGDPNQYLLKFATSADCIDWEILREGYKGEGVI